MWLPHTSSVCVFVISLWTSLWRLRKHSRIDYWSSDSTHSCGSHNSKTQVSRRTSIRYWRIKQMMKLLNSSRWRWKSFCLRNKRFSRARRSLNRQSKSRKKVTRTRPTRKKTTNLLLKAANLLTNNHRSRLLKTQMNLGSVLRGHRPLPRHSQVFQPLHLTCQAKINNHVVNQYRLVDRHLLPVCSTLQTMNRLKSTLKKALAGLTSPISPSRCRLVAPFHHLTRLHRRNLFNNHPNSNKHF